MLRKLFHCSNEVIRCTTRGKTVYRKRDRHRDHQNVTYILDKRKAIILVVLYTTAVADCYTCVRIKVAINSTHHQNLLVMSPSSATTPTKKLNYIVSEHCGKCSYSIFSSIIIFPMENITNVHSAVNCAHRSHD